MLAGRRQQACHPLGLDHPPGCALEVAVMLKGCEQAEGIGEVAGQRIGCAVMAVGTPVPALALENDNPSFSALARRGEVTIMIRTRNVLAKDVATRLQGCAHPFEAMVCVERLDDRSAVVGRHGDRRR